MVERKVGLALGSGSARGLAHIGVLEALEKAGIPVDMIAGTSIGALVGALYAREKDVERLKDSAKKWDSRRLAVLLGPCFRRTGLVWGYKIEVEVKPLLDAVRFSDLRIPLACVATDIGSGEEVVIREGGVWQAVRASGSLPLLFSPAKLNGQYLVDGGLVNPVPVSVVRGMGADFVIAVSVMRRKNGRNAIKPNAFTTAMHALNIVLTSSGLIASCLRG
ncbi:MAG: patatin-like phospholipase family protein, partial [Chloroflexi bacterium]|nr:patatin-like phospholipase family protein [Chloroflexota bacterium]